MRNRNYYKQVDAHLHFIPKEIGIKHKLVKLDLDGSESREFIAVKLIELAINTAPVESVTNIELASWIRQFHDDNCRKDRFIIEGSASKNESSVNVVHKLHGFELDTQYTIVNDDKGMTAFAIAIYEHNKMEDLIQIIQ